MKKIFIYEAEVIKKSEQLQDKVVNYVRLKRPEGLEEHMPDVGDIVNLYLPDNIIYMSHKVIGKKNDGIYIIESGADYEMKYDEVENLKDEGMEQLLLIPSDIYNEIKGLATLTRDDADLSNSLNLYFDFGEKLSDYESFYKFIKGQVIRAIKDKIKDIDVWVDPYYYGKIELYMKGPYIEEVIDKDFNGEEFEFKGIKEKEVKDYRLFFRTNIYKKGE